MEKKLRVIELFAGIGSQAKALKNLGIPFEHYRVVEWDKYAIQSYNAIHNTRFTTQDITKIKGVDLGVVETDKYDYLLTYSFPCQDLSKAGHQKGMSKGDHTRSGLLWEVERLLNETQKLPQYLLMENVPDVVGSKFIHDFAEWCSFLESKGYKNYYQTLNAKDYGIPQNRERCFMVSFLDKRIFQFPKPMPLKLRLKDLLENVVDEKYYISDRMLDYFLNNSKSNEEKGNGFRFKPQEDTADIAFSITAKNGQRMGDNFIINAKGEKFTFIESENQIGNLSGGRWDKVNECTKRVYNAEKISPTIHTMGGGNTEPKVLICQKGSLAANEPICLNSKVNGKQPHVQDRIYDTIGISTAITSTFMPNIAEKVLSIGEATPNSQAGKVYDPKGLSPALISGTHGYAMGYVKVLGNYSPSGHNASRIVDSNGVAPTVKENQGTVTATMINLRIRKLTPLECWRLMGFTNIDFYNAKQVNSDTQLYKQAGNSIVVNVLMAIFNKLFIDNSIENYQTNIFDYL